MFPFLFLPIVWSHGFFQIILRKSRPVILHIKEQQTVFPFSLCVYSNPNPASGITYGIRQQIIQNLQDQILIQHSLLLPFASGSSSIEISKSPPRFRASKIPFAIR